MIYSIYDKKRYRVFFQRNTIPTFCIYHSLIIKILLAWYSLDFANCFNNEIQHWHKTVAGVKKIRVYI